MATQAALNLMLRHKQNLKTSLTQPNLDKFFAKRNNLTDPHPEDLEVLVEADTIAVDGTEEQFTSTPVNFLTSGIEVGQFIVVSGFTEAANNGTFEVLAVTANAITVNGNLTTEAVGDDITISVEDTFRRGEVNTRFAQLHNLPASIIP